MHSSHASSPLRRMALIVETPFECITLPRTIMNLRTVLQGRNPTRIVIRLRSNYIAMRSGYQIHVEEAISAHTRDCQPPSISRTSPAFKENYGCQCSSHILTNPFGEIFLHPPPAARLVRDHQAALDKHHACSV